MKAGWQLKTLGEICSFENGDRGENYPSKSVQTATGVPFINAGHLSEFGLDFETMNYIPRERFDLLGNGKIRKDDILFCLRGSLGKFASVGDLPEGAIASSLVIVRPKESAINAFVSAYFQSDLCASMIDKYKNGAAQPNLSAASLKNFIIPLPPLPEQQRIVTILDEAFDGIDTAKANAEKNLQNARALFESHLQSVFTQRGKGWMDRRLGDVFNIGSSKRILETEWTSAGVPFYGGKEIVKLAKHGAVISNAYISEEKYLDYASRYDMPRKDDILITARGTIGVGYIVRAGDKFYYKDGNIISMRAKTPTNPHFILYAFRSNVMTEQLGELSGTTVRHLPIEKAKELVLRMPDSAVQNIVVTQIQKIEAETQRLESIYQQKLAALNALKKSLLDQAFTGQL